MADDRVSIDDLRAAQAQLEELIPVLDPEPGGVMEMTADQARRVADWLGREVVRRVRRVRRAVTSSGLAPPVDLLAALQTSVDRAGQPAEKDGQ